MEFNHFNSEGRAVMVDVNDKKASSRQALAKAEIIMAKATIQKIKEGQIKKGDVLAVAQVAGIMAAKKTADLIPMCHNLPLTACDLSFMLAETKIIISAKVKTLAPTGVEMEALTAASVAALTIYDMCKAIDKEMQIANTVLLSKSGGKSGDYCREIGRGRLLSVNISAKKGQKKAAIDNALLIADHGLENDAHAAPGIRQISLLAQESVDKMKAKGLDFLIFGSFAENLTTEGIILHQLPIGCYLKIGDSLHQVSQIGKECHHGCAIKEQAGDCIMPTEGIFTKVIEGGEIKANDQIIIMG